MDLQPIISHPAVRAARAALHDRDAETLVEQIRIAAIPAPSGLERERAAYLVSRFRELGLVEPRVDEVGNVIAPLPHSGAIDGGLAGDSDEAVLVTAHLDTIFPDGTSIRPTTTGERVHAPGITDNARGLAAMLALATALSSAKIATRRRIVLIGSVGEEGVGDLRGVKHLFNPDRRPNVAAFIALDGAGISRVVHRAIGVCRLLVRIRGLGGHSWGDRGLASPVNALGLAVARLRDLRPPGDESTAVNVGRLGGGTSVNAIPADAWLELDLRATDAEALAALEAAARAVFETAVRKEIEASTRGVPLVLEIEKIGDRPCGETPSTSPLVAMAVAATRVLGIAPELAASSTDANVPMSLGIPAIAIGAGGRGGGIHTADEWYENAGGVAGIERALLTILAVAEMG